LAFTDLATAVAWTKAQSERFSIAKVVMYPAIPETDHWQSEEVTEGVYRKAPAGVR
jgi:hypothetical protein